jgi:hypothetical protein
MQTITLSSAAFAASLISLLGPAVASHDRIDNGTKELQGPYSYKNTMPM